MPAGVPLVSGMTATVTIRNNTEAREPDGWRQRLAFLADRSRDIVRGPLPSPGCEPRIGGENGVTVTLPTPKPNRPLRPEEFDPDFAPHGVAIAPPSRFER